ncbi:MAG: Uma2 family endonuclease [Tumebacillaceae bacterium]
MEARKSSSPGPTNYAEYLQTPEGEQWEILDGVPFQMSAAPNDLHQKVVTNLTGEFYAFLKGKDCTVRTAPYAVRLFAEGKSDDKVTTVVQPDLSIICDRSKLDDKGCNGAPDLVIEVLSKSTAHYDRGQKLALYKASGVHVYWLVDPYNESIEVYDFKDDPDRFFASAIYQNGTSDLIPVSIFDDLSIRLSDLFL